MPNHCHNILHIDGDFNHRQEFVDRNKGFQWGDTEKRGEYSNLSFHAQVPMPKKHIVSHAKDSSNDGWYSWANKHWGTKWDAYGAELTHEQNYTYYTFDTAWCPPAVWIKKVSRKFPHLKFNVEWAEEGGEGGRFMIHKGVLHNYRQFNDAEWKAHMGYEEEQEE
tara:strand:- start:2402 stop:2896 length:495 start_codon:yes stop_codon:yes gene_type:complete